MSEHKGEVIQTLKHYIIYTKTYIIHVLFLAFKLHLLDKNFLGRAPTGRAFTSAPLALQRGIRSIPHAA